MSVIHVDKLDDKMQTIHIHIQLKLESFGNYYCTLGFLKMFFCSALYLYVCSLYTYKVKFVVNCLQLQNKAYILKGDQLQQILYNCLNFSDLYRFYGIL